MHTCIVHDIHSFIGYCFRTMWRGCGLPQGFWLWSGFWPLALPLGVQYFSFRRWPFPCQGSHQLYITIVSWRPTSPHRGFPNYTFCFFLDSVWFLKTLTSSMSHQLTIVFMRVSSKPWKQRFVFGASPARLDVSVKQRGCFSWCGTQRVEDFQVEICRGFWYFCVNFGS